MTEAKALAEIQKEVADLKEWITKQPELPDNDMDDALLHRFLHSCYYDLEATKTTIKLFYSIRSSASDLLSNRDPQSDQIQRALKIVNLAQIQISGGRNLWAWQLNDPGLDNYDYTTDAKIFVMSTDAWILSKPNLETADIVLMDVKDISLKFITKFNVSVAKKLSKYQESALPIRLKQIHVVNAPPFIDKVYSLLKPFIKQEICDMVHFHPPKSESLYKFLDKEDLPEDYGGTRESMHVLNEGVMKIVMEQRQNLINENLWRSTKKNKQDFSTDVGSFRSLAID